MTRHSAGLTFALLFTSAACGGTASYTYTFAPTDTGNQLSKNIYLQVVSPIKVPASAFKGGKLVSRPVGPEVCAFSQKITRPPAQYPQFKGKTLTLKIYGTSAGAKLVCALAKQAGAGHFLTG